MEGWLIIAGFGVLAILLILFFLSLGCRKSYVKSRKNQAILITGCDSGIGLALARHYHAKTNYSIICTFLKPRLDNNCGSDGYEQLRVIAESDTDKRLHLHQLDLTNDASIDTLVAYIDSCKRRNDFKHLWALVNNAGVIFMGEFDWQTRRQIETVVTVNLLGQLKLTRALLWHIIKAKGRIVNVSSVGDSTISPFLTVYGATKAAVTMYSYNLRHELRKLNCDVVVVRLGAFSAFTGILDSHQTALETMWASMDKTKQKLYEKYFGNFANINTEEASKNLSPKSIDNSPFFRDFNVALMAENPPVQINCAPVSFRLLLWFNSLLTLKMQDRLVGFALRYMYGCGASDIDDKTLDSIQKGADS